MWENLVGRLPEKLVIACIVLAYVVPYVVHKANTILHEYGDPPWKKVDREAEGKKTGGGKHGKKGE